MVVFLGTVSGCGSSTGPAAGSGQTGSAPTTTAGGSDEQQAEAAVRTLFTSSDNAARCASATDQYRAERMYGADCVTKLPPPIPADQFSIDESKSSHCVPSTSNPCDGGNPDYWALHVEAEGQTTTAYVVPGNGTWLVNQMAGGA
jgi:hypothetical protein